MKKSCVIIGGGIGGLFTGAFLAKNGLEVTVLEKNTIIGGGLQCFHRHGKIFETGMHVAGGFVPGGNLDKICRYLGINDMLSMEHIPSECMDEIYYHETGESFRISSGREGFIKSLLRYFPEEEKGLREYVDQLYRITEEVPLFHLKETPDGMAIHPKEFVMPADKLIEKYVGNPRLRELLAYLNPLYGGVKGHTPAYIHALINVLYINGASRFVSGSQQLADALKHVIHSNGGQVISDAEVTEIDVADKAVTTVKTRQGREFKADYYVSAIHPAELLKLVPPGTFLRCFVKRLNNIPNTFSAFSLYIDLKPDRLPYIDHTCYYMDCFGNGWNLNRHSEDWPTGFMYMTPPESHRGKYADRMLVHCLMDFDEVRQWENTTLGDRGADYEAWKQNRKEKVLDKLEKAIPGIRDMIAHVHASSPLTIRDYYHTKEGAIFGYRKDCDNLIYSQLPVYTKLRNLYLTGQNINLHGICGVPLTAILTAEAILGRNHIINGINHDEKNI